MLTRAGQSAIRSAGWSQVLENQDAHAEEREQALQSLQTSDSAKDRSCKRVRALPPCSCRGSLSRQALVMAVALPACQRVRLASSVILRSSAPLCITSSSEAILSQLSFHAQAKKQVTSLLVKAEALQQQLAARDASLVQATQQLQAAVAKADAAAGRHDLKARHMLSSYMSPRCRRPSHLLQHQRAKDADHITMSDLGCVEVHVWVKVNTVIVLGLCSLDKFDRGSCKAQELLFDVVLDLRRRADTFAGLPLSTRVRGVQVAELTAEAAVLADEVARLRRAETHQRDTMRRESEDRHRAAVREHELEMGTQIKASSQAEL